MRRLAVAGVMAVLVGLAALALPASANHTGQSDPNDTGGKLDVKAVRFDHFPGSPRWTFVTFGPWMAEEVWDRGYLLVLLDTRGDEEVDYLAVVRSDGRKLVANLYRLRQNGRQVEIGRLDAGKDRRTTGWVSVAIGKLSFGQTRTAYSWSVLSSFTGASCARTCFDRVPDDGVVEQPLPGVTPTPTPTPTPSPTVSPTVTPSPSQTPSPTG